MRDELLGRTPKDYDVATSATPDEVLAIFPRARTVGAQFGVVLARRFGHTIEVATFRTDGMYLDGRRPAEVHFGSAMDDAQRRDFTINGLFQNPETGEIIDHVGGQADLSAGRVRTIGDPDARFGEDHLRLLRAVRFAATLDFEIESCTFEAIRRSASKLSRISPERIWMELERILTCPKRARGWRLLMDVGLRPYLCPAWPADADRDARSLRVLQHLPGDVPGPELPLAAVLSDESAEAIEAVADGLRLSNRLRAGVVWLAKSLPVAQRAAELELADLKGLMNAPHWRDLPVLLRAKLEAERASIESYETLKARSATIGPEAIAPPPLVTGEDLQRLGYAPSAAFGRVLAQIYRDQLNEALTEKEPALRKAKKLMDEAQA